jgi:tRNA(fMet)-specific endonuclease VapC
MTRYILDTDHLSLLKRNHPNIASRVQLVPPEDIFVSIIPIEEQIRGRLAVISQVSTQPEKLSLAYDYLFESLLDLSRFNVLRFDSTAAQYFKQFRQQKVRIGSQDLKIASIALAQNAVLVTRNYRDFTQVDGLLLEDWSIGGGTPT